MKIEEDIDARLSGDDIVSNDKKSSWFKRKKQGITNFYKR